MSFRLSIITATLNRAEHLRRCIESVAAQPYQNKEHVIIDGGSRDDTVDLLLQYAARYPHIRWITEPDEGISDAFNKGLAMITGDAVGIIGDDDYYEPDVFGLVVEAFQQNPSAGLVVGNCAVKRNDGTSAGVLRACFSSRHALIAHWDHWGRDVVLPAPSTFVTRAAVERVGGFDLKYRYAMDYDHWIRITEHFPVHTMDRTLANFRHDEGTVSFSEQERQFQETLAISRRYWGSLGRLDQSRFLLSYQWFRLRRAAFRTRLLPWLKERVERA